MRGSTSIPLNRSLGVTTKAGRRSVACPELGISADWPPVDERAWLEVSRGGRPQGRFRPLTQRGELVGGDVLAQAPQGLGNLRTILPEAETDSADFAMPTDCLINAADYLESGQVRKHLFGATRSTRTLVEISDVALPDMELKVGLVIPRAGGVTSP